MVLRATSLRLCLAGAIQVMAFAAPAIADGDIGLRRLTGEGSSAAATGRQSRADEGWSRTGFREPSGAGPAARARREPELAAEPAERRASRNVQYVVFDQGLDAVIAEIGRLAGYAVSASREVRGPVQPGKLEGAADELIDQLRRAHNLVTMRDGAQLFVASEAESVTRVMRTGGETPERVREVLRNLAVDDIRRRVAVDERSGLIQLSAPPNILERIETILANASKTVGPAAEGGITVVRYGRRSVE